jgi:hypothetical protein
MGTFSGIFKYLTGTFLLSLFSLFLISGQPINVDIQDQIADPDPVTFADTSGQLSSDNAPEENAMLAPGVFGKFRQGMGCPLYQLTLL